MSSVGTLYTFPGQQSRKRVLAAAAAGGVKIDVEEGTLGETNTTPEFKAKFPNGKLPAFESHDGFKLFESAAIAHYVASISTNSSIAGANAKDAALIQQWISFADHEIAAPLSAALRIVRGVPLYNKPIENWQRDRLHGALPVLEAHLQTHTFLVGERISLADVSAATVIQNAFQTLVDAPGRAKLPNTLRWFETVVNQPLLKGIFGETKYIETALQYQPPKKEKEPKPAKSAIAEAASTVSNAASAAVAAVKPKSKKKAVEAEEDDDDDEPLVPEEPKAKNPLDSLPKSTFNLEDWKRAYSNMDTRGPSGSIEWFYQHFDKEGFSIWRVDFKYNEELSQVFMSSNQIGGFFNRLEASRKYLFGSVGVLGTANDSIITGTFICRGPDYKPVVEVAPDWESYEYKLLQPTENPEDKTFFEGALAWDLEIGGKKWADGKNFK